DGTQAGTTLVRDINLGGDSTPQGLTDVNGTLFFAANDGVHGTELWKSDGTLTGTVMVKDINVGALGSAPQNDVYPNGSGYFPLAAVNGAVYFMATDGTHGYELWRSDGTDAGTVQVTDLYTVGSGDGLALNITVVGNKVEFIGTPDGVNYNLYSYAP